MNRKIASIFLLLSLIVPLIGSFIWLKHQKSAVKREVKWNLIKGIEKEELVLLKFSSVEEHKQLKWEHSKEFEYQQEMYDVVEKKVIGDTIHYWCWWDNEETKLNKKLDILLAYVLGNDIENKETKKRMSDFFKSLYYKYLLVKSEVFISLNNVDVEYSFNYSSYTFSPAVPPPKIG